MLRALFLCLFILWNCCLSSKANLEAKYDHSAFLDPDENYQLFWTVKDADKTMNFAVKVKTTGWVGFGISPGLTGSMRGADIVIGWVDGKGKGHISDRHATSNSLPLIDNKQDYELTGASQQDAGITILKFKRKLATCDKNDLDIPLGTSKVIYAYGQSDDIKYHGSSTRGARSLNLMNYVKNVPPPTSVKYFDVTMRNVSVPKKKTTYWCEAFKMSDLVKLSGTRHIIEIAPIVEKKDRGVVHHIVLYVCSDSFDPVHLNASGPCYNPNMPDSVRQCVGKKIMYAWAVGGVNFKFPDHVGWPIGAPYSMKYVVLETHFDNPSQRTDFVVTSGLRFYYEKPRKYEAGLFFTGSKSDNSLIIPPNQENFIITGFCPKECSSKLATSSNIEEIKLFASLPHGHTAATGIWTKQVRNDIEIAEVIRNDNYDFNYQQSYLLKRELPFKAGDELITYCRYNTMGRKYATVGGLSTSDEMCLNFLMYYPRANFSLCYSRDLQAGDEFAAKYAKPLLKDGFRAYNKSVVPVSRQYQNWTGVKWNDTMVELLKNAYAYNGPDALAPLCLGAAGEKFNISKTKKPVIIKKLPTVNDLCTEISGAVGLFSVRLQLAMLIVGLLISVGFIFIFLN